MYLLVCTLIHSDKTKLQQYVYQCESVVQRSDSNNVYLCESGAAATTNVFCAKA
ncbi:hypothetical protein [Lysinibacillus sp. fls2-241-R2A-57]|uniref:hypothetical protein n=1 Tax=Lysinibacillus sp. fls2-241-R2A-57 TaxID=3040292 RepID=UPI002556D8D6|nr:hypothetical protein [Lysinibacillus sp. fls2-241-R2A-57]